MTTPEQFAYSALHAYLGRWMGARAAVRARRPRRRGAGMALAMALALGGSVSYRHSW